MSAYPPELLRRVLVLGAGGLLGAALCPLLRRRGAEVLAPPRETLDVTDGGALARYVDGERPTLVMNLAAASNVDACEGSPELAREVNGLGAGRVARAACRAGAPVVQISSDYIFEGEVLGGEQGPPRPYDERDASGTPTSVYGQTKALGEERVREESEEHLIVRIAALFGPGRRDVVDWVVDEAKPDAPLPLIDDCTISPTYTVDLAEQLWLLLASGRFEHGTYHATQGGSCSWYSLAREALRLAGKDPAGVDPVSAASLRRPAPRPRYSALENRRLKALGLDIMRPWQEALASHLTASRGLG